MDKSKFSLLSNIKYPNDLRKLSINQLPEVCKELREDIIDEVAVNPGHFASSLGVVEITVALHYVYNTPEDRIVWDVGHQAYGHKILTGRREAFCTNRKLHGIRPFPTPLESEYDTFTCGHASNSISAALGMAVAARETGNKDRHVVAVIGDGAMSGGLAFEGLNNVSSTPNDMLIILNDNDMSIDRAVGGMEKYLLQLDTNETYNKIRFKASQWIHSKGILNNNRKNGIIRLNNAFKSVLSHQQNIFEGMNIRYFGPFDGHDVKEVVRILKQLRSMKGPKLLHLHTTKGKGYEPAEKCATIWHAPGKFDPETGERIIADSSNKPPKFQDVFGKTHAYRMLHEHHDEGDAKPHLRRRYRRGSCSHLLGGNGKGWIDSFLQHLQFVCTACLRQYHPRHGTPQSAGSALPRPCRTGRRRWSYPSWCLRPGSPAPYPASHHRFADG